MLILKSLFVKIFLLIPFPSLPTMMTDFLSKLKIKDLLNQLIAKLGENIHISRFTRFQVGETSQDGE